MTFFTVGDMGAPEKAVAFEYEIIDYFDSKVDSGNIALSNQPAYTVTAKPSLPGYYYDVKGIRKTKTSGGAFQYNVLHDNRFPETQSVTRR